MSHIPNQLGGNIQHRHSPRSSQAGQPVPTSLISVQPRPLDPNALPSTHLSANSHETPQSRRVLSHSGSHQIASTNELFAAQRPHLITSFHQPNPTPAPLVSVQTKVPLHLDPQSHYHPQSSPQEELRPVPVQPAFGSNHTHSVHTQHHHLNYSSPQPVGQNPAQAQLARVPTTFSSVLPNQSGPAICTLPPMQHSLPHTAPGPAPGSMGAMSGSQHQYPAITMSPRAIATANDVAAGGSHHHHQPQTQPLQHSQPLHFSIPVPSTQPIPQLAPGSHHHHQFLTLSNPHSSPFQPLQQSHPQVLLSAMSPSQPLQSQPQLPSGYYYVAPPQPLQQSQSQPQPHLHQGPQQQQQQGNALPAQRQQHAPLSCPSIVGKLPSLTTTATAGLAPHLNAASHSTTGPVLSSSPIASTSLLSGASTGPYGSQYVLPGPVSGSTNQSLGASFPNLALSTQFPASHTLRKTPVDHGPTTAQPNSNPLASRGLNRLPHFPQPTTSSSKPVLGSSSSSSSSITHGPGSVPPHHGPGLAFGANTLTNSPFRPAAASLGNASVASLHPPQQPHLNQQQQHQHQQPNQQPQTLQYGSPVALGTNLIAPSTGPGPGPGQVPVNPVTSSGLSPMGANRQLNQQQHSQQQQSQHQQPQQQPQHSQQQQHVIQQQPMTLHYQQPQQQQQIPLQLQLQHQHQLMGIYPQYAGQQQQQQQQQHDQPYPLVLAPPEINPGYHAQLQQAHPGPQSQLQPTNPAHPSLLQPTLSSTLFLPTIHNGQLVPRGPGPGPGSVPVHGQSIQYFPHGAPSGAAPQHASTGSELSDMGHVFHPLTTSGMYHHSQQSHQSQPASSMAATGTGAPDHPPPKSKSSNRASTYNQGSTGSTALAASASSSNPTGPGTRRGGATKQPQSIPVLSDIENNQWDPSPSQPYLGTVLLDGTRLIAPPQVLSFPAIHFKYGLYNYLHPVPEGFPAPAYIPPTITMGSDGQVTEIPPPAPTFPLADAVVPHSQTCSEQIHPIPFPLTVPWLEQASWPIQLKSGNAGQRLSSFTMGIRPLSQEEMFCLYGRTFYDFILSGLDVRMDYLKQANDDPINNPHGFGEGQRRHYQQNVGDKSLSRRKYGISVLSKRWSVLQNSSRYSQWHSRRVSENNVEPPAIVIFGCINPTLSVSRYLSRLYRERVNRLSSGSVSAHANVSTVSGNDTGLGAVQTDPGANEHVPGFSDFVRWIDQLQQTNPYLRHLDFLLSNEEAIDQYNWCKRFALQIANNTIESLVDYARYITQNEASVPSMTPAQQHAHFQRVQQMCQLQRQQFLQEVQVRQIKQQQQQQHLLQQQAQQQEAQRLQQQFDDQHKGTEIGQETGQDQNEAREAQEAGADESKPGSNDAGGAGGTDGDTNTSPGSTDLPHPSATDQSRFDAADFPTAGPQPADQKGSGADMDPNSGSTNRNPNSAPADIPSPSAATQGPVPGNDARTSQSPSAQPHSQRRQSSDGIRGGDRSGDAASVAADAAAAATATSNSPVSQASKTPLSPDQSESNIQSNDGAQGGSLDPALIPVQVPSHPTAPTNAKIATSAGLNGLDQSVASQPSHSVLVPGPSPSDPLFAGGSPAASSLRPVGDAAGSALAPADATAALVSPFSTTSTLPLDHDSSDLSYSTQFALTAHCPSISAGMADHSMADSAGGINGPQPHPHHVHGAYPHHQHPHHQQPPVQQSPAQFPSHYSSHFPIQLPELPPGVSSWAELVPDFDLRTSCIFYSLTILGKGRHEIDAYYATTTARVIELFKKGLVD